MRIPPNAPRLFLIAIFVSAIACSLCAAGSTYVFASRSITTLLSKLNPSYYGQSVTFTATVTAPGATVPAGETVTFKDGSVVMGNALTTSTGAISFTYNSFLGGSHFITATYVGDSNLASSTSSSLLQTVRPAITSTVLKSANNPSALGSPVTLIATVSAPGLTVPAGDTVTFKDGSTVIGTGTTTSAGSANFTYNFTVGSHYMTATYAGDSNLAPSTSATLTQIVKASALTTVSPSNVTTVSTIVQSACLLWLNISSGSAYYVAPQQITIYYTVKKIGTCNMPAASGTLSLSSANTGAVYALIPINISMITSTPVTRVAYANPSSAPNGRNSATMLLTAGISSNLSATTFFVLQSANVSINNFNVSSVRPQVGSPLSLITTLFNNAFFSASNASINLKILSPNMSVYRTKMRIGSISPFQNLTIALNPGPGGIPLQPGSYLAVENVSFYSNYSSPSMAYTSNSLHSNTSTTSYIVYPNQNVTYTPPTGYPLPPASLGPVLIRSFPVYTDILAGTGASKGLNSLGLYDSANYPVTVNVTVPSLQLGVLTLSTNYISLLPSQNGTVQLQLMPNSSAIGTYAIPINISVVPQNGIRMAAQLYAIVSIDYKSSAPQVLSSVRLLNGNRNASVGLTILNPTNLTAFNLFLSTVLNSSITGSKRNILVAGQSGNVSLKGGAYSLSWTVSQLAPGGTAQVGYQVLNITNPSYVIVPGTVLSSTKQSSLSPFTIVAINKPQFTYPNTTVNITVSAVYTGTNVTTLSISLVPQPSNNATANVINSQQSFKVVPGSTIDATFTVQTSQYPGNALFKLTTPGAFAPQTQQITLTVQAKPISVFSLYAFITDPRIIFGAISTTVYISVLLYGKVSKMYKARKLVSKQELKSIQALSRLQKGVNEAIIEEGAVKRLFKRHANKDGSLGGFVEDGAIVGEDVTVAAGAVVENRPIVSGSVKVLDHAVVSGHAVVRSNAVISGNARVGDDTEVCGDAKIYGSAKAFGGCEIYDGAQVYGDAEVFGDARVYGEAQVYGSAKVYGSAEVSGDARVASGEMHKGEIVSSGRRRGAGVRKTHHGCVSTKK